MRRGTARTHEAQALPHQLTTFIGREIELAEVRRLLHERRLVTLTGAGGSGKTRLALEAAAALSADFPGGIFLVELAPLTRPELITETMARVVGVKVAPAGPPIATLTDFLRSRTALLLLDNCEHLLDECARLAGRLLAACPDLYLVATSREPLGVGGECVFRVPLLSLPDPSFVSDPARLTQCESVQLFVDRARLANPDFGLTGSTAEAVAQVCIHLDGIPLALELAAASLRALRLSELAARLDQRFRFLTSGNRTALPRQQTLKALLEWSHTLLSPPEQRIFRRLAVFPADWTLDAAEQICTGSLAGEDGPSRITPEDGLSILVQLVNKSLVQLNHATGRYHMLETIRLYALAKLEDAGEREGVARRHLDWYLQFAEQGSRHDGTGDQRDWFLSLEAEQDNIRAALSWAIATHRSDDAARLALALRQFWIARAYHREGLRWLEQVVSLDGGWPLGIRLKARLLHALGYLAQDRKRFEQARQYHTEALRLWREAGDSAGVTASLLELGWHGFTAADLDAAQLYTEESLTLARRAGDMRAVAAALNLLATTRIAAGILDGVAPAMEECLSIWRSLGVLSEVANALATYAGAEQQAGNVDHACSLLLEGLRLQTSLGTYTGLISPLVALFHFARDTCKPPEQYTYLARISGVFQAIEEKVGGGRSPWTYLEIFPLYEPLSAALGEESFARELAAGTDLSVQGILELGEEIVRAVLALSSVTDAVITPAPPPAPELGFPVGLTPREVEVLRLVAAGLTNQQAAERLSITARTVNAHLTSIYGKTGVTTRAGAVRFALDHGLA